MIFRKNVTSVRLEKISTEILNDHQRISSHFVLFSNCELCVRKIETDQMDMTFEAIKKDVFQMLMKHSTILHTVVRTFHFLLRQN